MTLVLERPNVLSKAVLQQRLWPDTFVAEANLSNLVAEIREALGDQARAPVFVRTVHGFGYAFCGDATTVRGRRRTGRGSDRRAGSSGAGGAFRCPLGEHVIGRDPDVDVRLDASTVSRRHARLVVTAEGTRARGLRQQERHVSRRRARDVAGSAGRRRRDPHRLAAGDFPCARPTDVDRDRRCGRRYDRRPRPHAIANGTRIGPYEIVGWLGAGGMGEVYRARDPRLGRDVAIKLIPETLATDASRLHRFEQEARAAGQLNHPNILAVYDVGVHAGAPYIVSELLEGESLRSRLQAGALPPRKAIDYARQIGEGLAAAHEQGHRPSRREARQPVHHRRRARQDSRLRHRQADAAGRRRGAADRRRRPTPMAGMVVGTAGYMSPEQVRGETVDGRSDIFSLGTMLYEMLTGRPAFTRATAAETMAAILKEDPAEPLAGGRSAAARTHRVALPGESARGAFPVGARSGVRPGMSIGNADPQSMPRLRSRLPGSRGSRPRCGWRAIATVLALTVALTRWQPWADLPIASHRCGSAPSWAAAYRFHPSTSRSGMRSPFLPTAQPSRSSAQSDTGDKSQIYVRRLAELQATPLSGTDYAAIPFFSPDGKWIGFFAGGKLKKVAVGGGAPITLADAPDQRGAWWSEDDTIVFSPTRTAGTRLLRVSAAGGPADALAPLADAELIQLWPQVLPGGRGLLYHEQQHRRRLR